MKVRKLNKISFLLVMGAMIVALSYSFGFEAGFLLDDYATLPFLGQWGGINSLDHLKDFVQSGFTGPTGRPVALATFAVNSLQWPTDPLPFLVTNTIIHIFNTLLAYLFISSFLKLLRYPDSAWVALAASLIWAAHPYLVSTVLYVVQRMVLLAVFFNFLALISYLKARTELLCGSLRRTCFWFLLAVICSLLSICSKEMAILIPLQIGLIELALSSSGQTPLWGISIPLKSKRIPIGLGLVIVGIVIPVAIITAFLAIPIYQDVLHLLRTGNWAPSVREFNLVERLLTEQRVVGDYLRGFFVPSIQTAGVFWDGYEWSRSLLDPISTLGWLIVHIFLIVFASLMRKRAPLFFFGVLWFYAGLSLESTTVMLELKFEHRAYWPFVGLALAVVSLLSSIKLSSKFRSSLLVGIFIAFCISLSLRASLWGNPYEAHIVWMNENPRSTRAIESALLVVDSDADLRVQMPILLQKAVSHENAQAGVYLQAFTHFCSSDDGVNVGLDVVIEKLSFGERDWRVASLLEHLLVHVEQSHCDLGLKEYLTLVQAALGNQVYWGTGLVVSLNSLVAKAELLLGDKERAKNYYLSQDHSRIPLGLIMKQSLTLVSAGELDAAANNLSKGLVHPFEASDFLIEQGLDMLNKIEADMENGKLDD